MKPLILFVGGLLVALTQARPQGAYNYGFPTTTPASVISNSVTQQPLSALAGNNGISNIQSRTYTFTTNNNDNLNNGLNFNGFNFGGNFLNNQGFDFSQLDNTANANLAFGNTGFSNNFQIGAGSLPGIVETSTLANLDQNVISTAAPTVSINSGLSSGLNLGLSSLAHSNQLQSNADSVVVENANGFADQQQVQQAEGQVFKHVYIHSAPDEPEEIQPRRPITVPPPQTHYKVIFIKAPAPPKPTAPVIPVQQQNREKTLVYVLLKKPEEQPEIKIPTPEPTQPSKPEIFFIKYKTQEEASAAIDKVNSAIGAANTGAISGSSIQSQLQGLNLQGSVENDNTGNLNSGLQGLNLQRFQLNNAPISVTTQSPLLVSTPATLLNSGNQLQGFNLQSSLGNNNIGNLGGNSGLQGLNLHRFQLNSAPISVTTQSPLSYSTSATLLNSGSNFGNLQSLPAVLPRFQFNNAQFAATTPSSLNLVSTPATLLSGEQQSESHQSSEDNQSNETGPTAEGNENESNALHVSLNDQEGNIGFPSTNVKSITPATQYGPPSSYQNKK